ncbi:hypothetical protein NC658_02780 [Streptomyces griseoincarnatus]|uniref:DUF4235 domain-containing protein n=1 Tax=Streptomyces griseoincarnatus TaxID=29305 RepID=A0ABT0VPZ0_STRGI|nr:MULTISPECIES: hypothetical protein [Streptomyces]MBJ6614030.1 hypothetical protein [Streptomyces sp. I3(2020)]MBJ6624226.1 hypothetical protein [Streptomyces sp. I4(2020)]MCM2512186.1 hypothetical protein [Streptomyces griseoincarnatus]
MAEHAHKEGTVHGPSTKRGLVGMLLQGGAGLAAVALVARLLEAVVPVSTAAAATQEGGNAFAASVLRAVGNGALAAAVCVVQFAVLLLCFRGLRICWNLLRGRRSEPRPV